MHSRFFFVLPVLAAVAGCATLNPFGGGAPDATAIPAVASATSAPVVSAVSTTTSADPRLASLSAAGVKPLGGAEIGGYVDGEEAALRDALGAAGVTVTRAGNRLAIDIPAAVAFDPDKSQVKPTFTTTLYAIAIVLKNFNRTTVDVLGYSDSQGSPADSQDLTQRRAVAVASLLSNQGVDQRRFFIEGRGGTDPIASNATEAGRAQNRRVEIQIAPLA